MIKMYKKVVVGDVLEKGAVNLYSYLTLIFEIMMLSITVD